MREAGVAVEIEERWGRAGIDAATSGFGLRPLLSFGFVGAVLFGLV